MSQIPITEDKKIIKVLIHSGSGDEPRRGQKVKVNYTGKFEDGKVFDSTKGKEPFVFKIGEGVIEGWNIAVLHMKIGEKSRFTIAPEYAYGKKGVQGVIPPNSTLVFEIELLGIVHRFPTNEEAVAGADELCKKAANEFRAGNFLAALDYYNEGLEIANEKYGKEIDDLKKRLNRNLSVVYAKLALWPDSLAYAEKVLSKDPCDAKALMRKLEAELQLNNTAEARKALDKGLSVTKRDAAFVRHIAEVEKRERAERLRELESFKGLAGK